MTGVQTCALPISVVEVFEDGKEKVTYVKMTPEKAKRVVEEHLKGGKPVSEYLIGNTKL